MCQTQNFRGFTTAPITHQRVDALVRQVIIGRGVVLDEFAILDEVALANLVDLNRKGMREHLGKWGWTHMLSALRQDRLAPSYGLQWTSLQSTLGKQL